MVKGVFIGWNSNRTKYELIMPFPVEWVTDGPLIF